MMSRYFDEIKASIERHGGTVEKFIGDAVMAVFGIPLVHEDDALQRCAPPRNARGARAPQQGARARARRHARGTDGMHRRGCCRRVRQTLVTGDTVNVAARLKQAAAPGEVLIGG